MAGDAIDDDGDTYFNVDDWVMRYLEVITEDKFERDFNDFILFKDTLSKDQKIGIKTKITSGYALNIGLHISTQTNKKNHSFIVNGRNIV
mgnify:CR=1 FL=1